MTKLVRMTRADGAIADVRPEWVDEWKGRGWRVEGEDAPKPRGRQRKDAD